MFVIIVSQACPRSLSSPHHVVIYMLASLPLVHCVDPSALGTNGAASAGLKISLGVTGDSSSLPASWRSAGGNTHSSQLRARILSPLTSTEGAHLHASKNKLKSPPVKELRRLNDAKSDRGIHPLLFICLRKNISFSKFSREK